MFFTRCATRGCLTATALIASGALIAGCGGSSAGGTSGGGGSSQAASTPSRPMQKAVSLSRAADLSTKAAGFRMRMRMHIVAAGQSVDMNATGAFDVKSHEGAMHVRMAGGGQNLDVRVVLSRGTIYEQLPSRITAHLPGGKPWISMNLKQLSTLTKIPGFSSLVSSSSSMRDPVQYMDYLKAAADGSLRDLGQSTVAGVQTTHYRFRLDLAKLSHAVPPSARRGIAEAMGALEKRFHVAYGPMNVWVDQADLVRKLQVSVNETVKGRAVSSSISELISDYGQQPAPTVPAPSETTNVMSLIHRGG